MSIRPHAVLLLLLLLAVVTVAAAASTTSTSTAANSNNDDDDDDLQYLIDNADDAPDGWLQDSSHAAAAAAAAADQRRQVDETHVVVLAAANFSAFLAARRHVMVEFYAPGCAHCQALAPAYAAAAAALAGEDVALAKVDAAEHAELAREYDIQGFPVLLFFINGVATDYTGHGTKEAIVAWISKKLAAVVHDMATVDDAQRVLATADKAIVVALLDSLSGADNDELAAASKLEDTVNFYRTSNPDAAKVLHIDPAATRPSLVVLKKEDEKLTFYEGEFRALAIADFVSANKLPLVSKLTQETGPSIFESHIKKQIILFAAANESSKFLPIFKEAAKAFKGKLIFVLVERDNGEAGERLAEYFGVNGRETTVLAYTGVEDAKKFLLDDEVSLDTIKKFADGFLEGKKLTPFYKSEPVPEYNDGDVKIVVGKNLDQIVLDESKDVLLEMHTPWCGHCQKLEPTYNKLAKHLRGIDSLVIAKMNAFTNEHPRAKSHGVPTILFYPAGKKSFEPITYDGDRTVVEMYKFIKKHAGVPFKLKRQDSSAAKTESIRSITMVDGEKRSGTNHKDEL
ncbi:hypothetical protein ACP70R_002646 [Stipagrostis hirtigluma subsp. patula]